MYPFTNQESARQFARMVAEEMKALDTEPKQISFSDAMVELGIKYDALRRRIAAAGVKTYWMNGGKAFDRKHMNKLR